MDVKKQLKNLLILFFVGIFVFMVARFLRTGVVEIKAEKGSAVYYVSLSGGGDIKQKKAGKGNTRIRLKPGLYTVGAHKDSRETRSLVSVTSRETKEISLPLKNTSESKEITDYTAYDIISSGGQLRFLNKPVNQIYEYRKSLGSAAPVLFELFPIVKMNWLDYGEGLAQMSSGDLAVLKGSRVFKFNYPDGLKPEGDFNPIIFSYSLNDNGELVVNIEGNIYYYGHLLSAPKKIYVPRDRGSLVSLSNNGTVLVYTSPFINVEDNTNPETALINTKGDILRWGGGSQFLLSKWSPLGDKIIVTEDSRLKLYDLKKQTTDILTQFIPDNAGSTTWIADDSLLIVDDGSVWELNILSGLLSKLSALPEPVRHPDALTVSENGFVHFGSTPSGDIGSYGKLYELKLRD